MLGQPGQTTIQGVADVRLESLARAPAVLPIYLYVKDRIIPNDVETVVVRFKMRRGHVGYLSGLGHETTNVGWNFIRWSITVKGTQQRGWQGQIGRQWGRTNQPGQAYIVLTEGAKVEMRAFQLSGSTVLASGLLVGYFWSRVTPVEQAKL